MDWTLIIQGGGIGLAVYSIYALLKVSESTNKIISNHIDHSTEAINKLAVALEKLAAKLDKPRRK